MLFLQTILINLVLTKCSGQKWHAVMFSALIFAGFCVSGGGGMQVERTYTVDLPRPDLILTTLLSV